MDWDFFQELLNFDSTSGKEWEVAEWLVRTLPDMFPPSHRPDVRADEVGDGTINLLFTWGEPKIVFCSHLDTVPPYIAPTVIPGPTGNLEEVRGRGACDAKGQVFSGNMDLVWRTANGCVLVDYKTFPGNKAELFNPGSKHWAGNYASQLSVYADALSATPWGKPLDRLLYYPVEGMVIRVKD